jgi:hypothetical protein
MRLGINVPDQIIRRMKELDPEVNVSQVCRDAMQAHCDTLERIRGRVAEDGMKDHVRRFSEGQLDEPDWVGYALDDARDWVNAVPRDEWDEFFHRHDILTSRGEDVTWLTGAFFQEGVKCFTLRFSENSEWFRQEHKANRNSDFFKRAQEEYVRVWLAYVEEVHRMQEQYFAERLQDLMVERERAWAARPGPEVPPSLLH